MNQEILGDCLEVMPTLESGSVDCIITDLPYQVTACHWDTIIPFEPLWKEYKRIIKDNGAIILTATQPFATDVINSNRVWFKYEWIWDKHIPRGFQVAKYKPMTKHENILVFGKDKVNYYPQKVKRDKPVKVKNYGNSKSNPLAYNDKEARVYDDVNPNTLLVGYWEANAGKIHPTQKPVTLFEYLIQTYTKEHETVLDSCAGSFTTAIACINTNRFYICIERDPEYYRIGTQRIREHLDKKSNELQF